MDNVIISGDSPTEIFDKIWIHAEKYVKREIIIKRDDNDKISASWAEKEKPTREDIDKFIILQTSTSKRNIYPSQFPVDSLRASRNKTISVYIHIYSRSVCNHSIYNELKESFLINESRNTSVAEVEQAEIELADLLRETHQHTVYAPTFMSWRSFARYIMEADASQRDTLIHQLPPHHLMHLFRTIPTSENIRLDRAQHQIVVARNVNDSHMEDLQRLRASFNACQSTLEILSRQMTELNLRMEAMESVSAGNERLISAVDSSLLPFETQESIIHARDVEDDDDLDDIDHMEP
jgi:hypothetical protein